MGTDIKKAALMAFVGLLVFSGLNAQDGKALFKSNCGACHSAGNKRLVGPGLGSVRSNRDAAWLKTWIKDPMAFIKSGNADAIAIYEEYNKSPMPPFSHLSDAEIEAIITFLPEGKSSEGLNEVVDAEPEVPVEYTAEDGMKGKALFDGSTSFINRGPSCITCHNVSDSRIPIKGGLLAKDLTKVYDRMGHEGIGGLLNAPPFPAMANSYGNSPLTEDEIFQLSAFFKEANQNAQVEEDPEYGFMIKWGVLGLVIWIIIIMLIWNKRKKESVKKDIFSRQSKSNDSIES